MMTRNPDILFLTEYIKNVLYFATVRQGKVLKSTSDIHYFCIDNDLVYENYYSDFGPLNLGCLYRYCKILNEKLKIYLNKQSIVHYTSIDPKRKANAAYLLGCYGVLYLNLTPKEALKPLTIHGQTYRPFQDATQGDSMYTITLMDCLHAIRKAKEVGFFNFQDFDYEEYERLDKIQGGDLNWIVPGKFLAFIGPVDYSVSLYHPPEMYIDYFVENKVGIVIRLNKRMYDGNVFNNAGIIHYDLFFPDGSCPPRHILFKFLQISEEADGALAVHCKAGLGRTGSLIGCYLMKHYRMTAHEAIGWMRICRPGSVIGHQQSWLEQLEPWLIKQGNLYRKRTFQDTEKLPIHEYGVYSIAEKSRRQKPVVINKSPSPPPPIQRQTRSDITPPLRPQASKASRDESNDEELFITQCDLTSSSNSVSSSLTQMKGCVLKTASISEQYDENDPYLTQTNMPFWKRLLCCDLCSESLWVMAVHCARFTPPTRCCNVVDRIQHNVYLSSFFETAPSKIPSEKEPCEWRVKTSKIQNQKVLSRELPPPSAMVMPKKDPGPMEHPSCTGGVRRGFAGGEPRTTTVRPIPKSPSKVTHTSKSQLQRHKENPVKQQTNFRNVNVYPQVLSVPTYTTSNGPMMKSMNEAKNFLMRTSMYKDQREKQLNSALTVTPQSYRPTPTNYFVDRPLISPSSPPSFNSSLKTIPTSSTQPLNRRRLGRSPSPSPSPSPTREGYTDHTRATNTQPMERFLQREASKSALREALSRLKLSSGRDGSVGAASLGARRDAPSANMRHERRAPSVRSDERPLATQGDLLNSIKFQRRFRDLIGSATKPSVGLFKFKDKTSTAGLLKDKPANSPRAPSPVTYVGSGTSTGFPGYGYSNRGGRDKSPAPSKPFNSTPRPTSPKGRTRQAQVTTEHYFY